jgi:hypothetical protein
VALSHAARPVTTTTTTQEETMSDYQIVSDVLNGAADHVQKYGLHKGSSYASSPADTSPACTIGAIGVACGDIANDLAGDDFALFASTNRDLLHDAIDVVTEYHGCIPTWSDHPDTTADDVIEALRAAAVIAETRANVPAEVPC